MLSGIMRRQWGRMVAFLALALFAALVGGEADAKPKTLGVKVAEQYQLPSAAKAQKQALLKVTKLLEAGQTEKATDAWRAFSTKYFNEKTVGDEEALVHWVLREAILVKHPKLDSLVDRIRYFDEARVAARECLVEQRAVLGDMTKGSVEKACKVTLPPYQPGARVQVTIATYDKKQLQASIASLEALIASLGSESEMASLNLQNALENQQGVVQMLSNVSKQLHDTARAVIRNMGG
jgi:hypothetical protein